MQEAVFSGKNGHSIFYRKWLIDNPKAIVQIAHGMAEHSLRYDRFAKFLNDAGYSVYANDHRGHGHSADKEHGTGYFLEGDFFENVIYDLDLFTSIIQKENEQKPIFLFGHSMGSFLAREYLENNNRFKGAIFSGTAGSPGLLGNIGLSLARTVRFFTGRKSRSTLLTLLTFGKFGMAFKPRRTNFDWLSRDEKEVDKYINDPLCGQVFTAGFFVSLLRGILHVNSASHFSSLPKKLPLLFISGAKDPVGEDGKSVQKAYDAYANLGIEDITLKLYEDARHELLNETNRDEVMEYILKWMEERV